MGSLKASDRGVSDKLSGSLTLHVIGVLKSATLGSHCSLLGLIHLSRFSVNQAAEVFPPLVALIDGRKEAI